MVWIAALKRSDTPEEMATHWVTLSGLHFLAVLVSGLSQWRLWLETKHAIYHFINVASSPPRKAAIILRPVGGVDMIGALAICRVVSF